MKTLTIIGLIFLSTVLSVNAQQANNNYQHALKEIASLGNAEEKSEKKGKSLAVFFEERKAEAGAETAFTETHKLLLDLKATDFYAAFFTLMKIKSYADMEIFRKTDFTAYEQDIIRNKLSDYSYKKIISKGTPPTYPTGVPLPGYSWNNASTTTTAQSSAVPTALAVPSAKTIATNQSSGNNYVATKIDKGQADYETALKAFEANALDKALRFFKEAGRKGHVLAMYKAGEMLEQRQQYADAKLWYRKAADAGLINGMYKTGTFNEKDKAIKWYNKAIQAGNALVLENYQANCYKCKGAGKLVSQTRLPGTGGAIVGQTVTQNNATTIRGGSTTVTTHYSSPTYQTSTYACENCKGTGAVTLKETLPSGYFNAKAALEFATGQTEFEKATEEYKAEKYSKALKLYIKAAEKGNIQAMYSMGTLYHNGQGVKKDDTQALQWYNKAAALGSEDAKKALQRLNVKP